MRRSPSSAQSRSASSRRRHSASSRSSDAAARRHELATAVSLSVEQQDAKHVAASLDRASYPTNENQDAREDDVAVYSDGGEAEDDGDDSSRGVTRSQAAAAAAAPFNPLVALQHVLAGDMVPIKQRAKAAKELAEYMDELPTNQGLYSLYEPYLSILGNVVMVPIKAAKDVQDKTLQLMAALGAHNPRRFVEWCALHVRMNPMQPPWHVKWCTQLLIKAERRVPRPATSVAADNSVAVGCWVDRCLEVLELDASISTLCQLWRSLLDHTNQEELVHDIVLGLHAFLVLGQSEKAAKNNAWKALIVNRIQPHFVDMADVLIGWATSSATSERVRDDIILLLYEMRPLWITNSVFAVQILDSFSKDIVATYTASSNEVIDEARLNSITVCCMMVADCVPSLALASTNGDASPIGRVLRALVSTHRAKFSPFCTAKCGESFLAMTVNQPGEFAPLAVRAVHFLLAQVAANLECRAFDNNQLTLVLANATRVAAASFSMISALPSAKASARALLDAAKPINDSGETKRVRSVVSILLRFQCLGLAQHVVSIYTRSALLIGHEGLLILLENAIGSYSVNQPVEWIVQYVFLVTFE
ncbi:hypothetical protein PINS_up011775 [Pythium insidiosum]|nr:hypothetical protein PINS_up011775 [Pythium insidiosum]